jgi:hypothetical protein
MTDAEYKILGLSLVAPSLDYLLTNVPFIRFVLVTAIGFWAGVVWSNDFRARKLGK